MSMQMNEERLGTPKPRIRHAREQAREELSWLWPGRVSMGALTLIAGDPGVGKSMVTLDLTARVTRGTPWPGEPIDGPTRRYRPGVVLLSGEDDWQSTIMPRLKAMDADVGKVVCVNSVTRYNRETMETRECFLSLDRDVEAVRSAMIEVPRCGLVVIDPITSFLGRVDANRAQAVRYFLRNLLAELRGKTSPAVVMVAHLNKTRRGNAMSGIAGAMSFAAVARSVWMVMKDAEDETGARRLFLPVKNNLGVDAGGLAFSVGTGTYEDEPAMGGGKGEAALVNWEPDAVPMTADQALAGESDWLMMERHARAEAKVWLGEVLAGGPMAAKEVYARAMREGISRKTLERAKMEMGVVGKKFAFTAPWSWYTPAALAAMETETAKAKAVAMPEGSELVKAGNEEAAGVLNGD